jgi:hypothetical protein
MTNVHTSAATGYLRHVPQMSKDKCDTSGSSSVEARVMAKKHFAVFASGIAENFVFIRPRICSYGIKLRRFVC